jgi:hypothetical protein
MDRDSGSRAREVATDITEGQRAFESWREERARYITDLLFFGMDRIPTHGHCISFKDHSDKFSIDMASRVDTLDNLLTQVAPFCETHRAV